MEIVEAKDLRQMTDQAEIESLCRGIVQDPRHAKQVCGVLLLAPLFRCLKTTLCCSSRISCSLQLTK